MSLQWKVAISERSACTTSASCSKRNSIRSVIETTSMRPSGIHPSPLGWPSTVSLVATVPSRSTVFTA